MNVGAELARARHFRGLSIRDISNRTKVSEQTLSAIEDNQVGDIPTVEVRDVLQAYAVEVDLDPEDVIYRYFAHFEAPPRVDVLRASRWSIDEFPSEATIPLNIEQPDIVQPRDHRNGRE